MHNITLCYKSVVSMHRKSVLISNIHFHILRSFERILAKSLIYTKKVVINRYGNNVPVRCILKRHVALWFQVEMFPLLAILQLSGMMHCIRHKCVILSTIGHRYVKFSLKKKHGKQVMQFHYQINKKLLVMNFCYDFFSVDVDI